MSIELMIPPTTLLPPREAERRSFCSGDCGRERLSGAAGEEASSVEGSAEGGGGGPCSDLRRLRRVK